MRNWRRLTAAMAIGAGVGLLVVAAVDRQAGRPAPAAFGGTSVGGSPALTSAAPSAPAPSAAAPSALVTRPAAGPPVSLAIPSQQVWAGVVPVVNVGGVLQVPDDPAQVGWWNASAPIGSTQGTVVIDGHVDSASAGPGALFRLAGLRVSDRIVLTTAAGASSSYEVIGRRVYGKAAGLPSGIFDSTGPPRLVLISCGGPFDQATGSYLDNIVVFAVPA